MKKIIISLIFVSIIYCNGVYAQFNTLTPPIAQENLKNDVIPKIQEKDTISTQTKKKKGFWSFFSSKKKQMQKEIDSLKLILNKKENIPKIDYKKIEDSIIVSLAKKIIDTNFQKTKENEQKDKYKKTTKQSKMALPIAGDIIITSPFGWRLHPILKKEIMHNGIDIKAEYEYVFSVLKGVVSQVGWDSNGGGIFMKVQHNNGFETSYLHLSEFYYKVGEKVNAGDIIAKSGNTGNSTAPHLHFSVKEKNIFIDPAKFLNNLITINNYITQNEN